MLKDPAVENTVTIKAFQTDNHFSTDNSLILKGDTTSAQENLMKGFKGYEIFNADGDLVCYNGSSTCSGTQFHDLLANKKDSFQVCKNETVTLDKVLNNTYDLNEQTVTKQQFAKADYYVVSYWQKFIGGKKGYEEAVKWMEDEIKKGTSASRFVFIKINTDLQENWGLTLGEKAKLKVENNRGKTRVLITDFPAKR